MPTLQNTPKVIAIMCADLHLCLDAPPCRKGEKNWLETLGGYLDEIERVRNGYNVPVLCAGDIFDKWDSGPELINFALQRLPQHMFTIPGQHDLPHHSMVDIKRSAYWTLVAADRINDISFASKSPQVSPKPNLVVRGFGWGEEVKPPKQKEGCIHVAMIHAYCWKSGCSFQGASIQNSISNWRDRLADYDVALFGDNHKGFQTHFIKDDERRLAIRNNGCLYRRRSDEEYAIPSIGLLDSDGFITNYPLNISHDVFDATAKSKVADEKISDADERIHKFIKDLVGSDNLEKTVDFGDAIRNWIQQNPKLKRTARILVAALEI